MPATDLDLPGSIAPERVDAYVRRLEHDLAALKRAIAVGAVPEALSVSLGQQGAGVSTYATSDCRMLYADERASPGHGPGRRRICLFAPAEIDGGLGDPRTKDDGAS